VFTGEVQRVQGLRPDHGSVLYKGILLVCLQVKFSVFKAYARAIGLWFITVYYLCVFAGKVQDIVTVGCTGIRTVAY